MKLNTKHTIYLTFCYFICLIQKTWAQLQPISDAIIHFNASGINYPEDILFSLYTRDNENVSQKLLVEDEKLLKQNSFDVSKPTKLITHGWKSSGMSESCELLKQSFLQHGDYNVIIVDWSSLSKKEYASAASRVKAVGMYISEMIKFLVKQGSNIKQMSLVGHSLGAHVMGMAAYKLSPKVGHIVGLDPARPGFEMNGPSNRLHHTQADYVEVIHTNAGNLGFTFNIGKADYWPNGGFRQPGCGKDMTGGCAHGRSYMYYAESLERPNSLYGVLCTSYVEFLTGLCRNNSIQLFPIWEPILDKPKGSYMLRTKDSSPFGLGREGVIPPTIQDFI